MKKMLFLFNPRSGKEQIKSHLLRILDIFSKAGYDIHVHVTQCQLDARKTVEHLGKNVDVIVCSGGDGTLNETISGMLQLKKTPSLGYIPAGSTNDFASSLKNRPFPMINVLSLKGKRGYSHNLSLYTSFLFFSTSIDNFF